MKGRIKRRLTTLKINDPEDPIFANYALLRRWLLDHYGSANADVTAAQKMFELRQRYDQPLQDFVNDFETIMADLDWNDAALSDAFSRKLHRALPVRSIKATSPTHQHLTPNGSEQRSKPNCI